MKLISRASRQLRDRPWCVAFVWLLPAAVLPAVPIDETRYLSIAWEMRQSGDVIGLTLNGLPYMDKSPLLFWLINVAWAVFGVSTLAARVVCICSAAGAVACVVGVARRLRHPDPAVTGWILLPFVMFGALTPIAMFDVPLVFFVALGFLGLVRWLQGEVRSGIALVLVAFSLGLLMKGPVYLVHLLGPVATVRWWRSQPLERPFRIASGIGACVLLSSTPLAAWAVVSAMHVGSVSVIDTLAHHSIGRVANSFAHSRSVLWYLPWVLPFLLPWALLVRWKRLRHNLRVALATSAGRFGVAATLPAFVLFSLISGKQLHYLLPLLPGMALLLASLPNGEGGAFSFPRVRILLLFASLAWVWFLATTIIGERGDPMSYVAIGASFALLLLGASVARTWGDTSEGGRLRKASFASLMALAAGVLLLGVHVDAHMDPSGLATVVKDLQRRGVTVAAVDDEPGMITYLARLAEPLPVVTDHVAWARDNPSGLALVHAGHGSPPAFVQNAVILQDGWEGLVPAQHLAQVRP
ncbi:glycosyltransferase family 39 protein [Luteibacter sp. SG786]|uniref:ArnT family glycosyltransferase n=1 Tax=Luteibacter sp. SG786 TaxID=2587130 RepID=UPI00141FFFFD|nr:glycosyltransferase family 39 protein [Luteibacter sp. SG786]NII54008.1 4-amino-4-deoxy-L-arabinose transferase-like glycosyltransferase [Luteibacter sp. SG786]